MARFSGVWGAGMAILISGSALAQSDCPAGTEPLPPALAAWSAAPGALSKGTMLVAGTPARVALESVSTVRFAAPPEREPKPDSFGGVIGFDVQQAGTWRVALSGAGWIDVLVDGKVVPSAAHGHGPACSGIRKIVDFALPAGTYALQISSAATDSIDVMVTRAP